MSKASRASLLPLNTESLRSADNRQPKQAPALAPVWWLLTVEKWPKQAQGQSRVSCQVNDAVGAEVSNA